MDSGWIQQEKWQKVYKLIELNNSLLNKNWVKEENKKEAKNLLELNEIKIQHTQTYATQISQF